MDEEEARLKALLDQTSDYDERKKIRADLRAVRMKKLDSLNNAMASESSERAARRAERARARKAEQMNGDASAAEKDSSQAGVVITEQILAEIEDEETLQKLLNEIPASQFEDRRRIRARIREVKRKKAEGEPASQSTYSRRAEKVTVTTDEPSSVTIETTVESRSTVTNHSGGDEELNFKVTLQHEGSSEPASESAADEPDEVPAPCKEAVGKEDEVAAEDEEPSEEREEKPPEVEPEENEPKKEIPLEVVHDDVQENEYAEEKAEDENKQTGKEEAVDIRVTVDANTVKEESSKPVEEVKEEMNDKPSDGSVVLGKDFEISVEVKLDNNIQLDVDADKEVPESTGEVTQDNDGNNNIKPVRESDSTDGENPCVKDKVNDVKQAPKSERSSRWPPPADDRNKKTAATNTTDFRNNLKKSGKIGTSVVNLERKNVTSGAQVDFRSEQLKKSARLGAGVVNLEKKHSTTGAQVDFRAEHLKKSGRIGSKGVVNLENKISTAGAQVDFRGNLKSSGKSPVNVKIGALGSGKEDVKGKGDHGAPFRKRGGSVEETSAQKDASVETNQIATPPEEDPAESASEGSKNHEELTPSGEKEKELETVLNEETKEDSQASAAPEEIKEDAEVKEEKEEKEEKASENVPEVVHNEKQVEKKITAPVSKVAANKFATRDAKADAKNSRFFQNLSSMREKEKGTPAQVKAKVSPFANRSAKKADTGPATDKAVNGVTVQVKNTALVSKEPSASDVKIEVSEHAEDEGDTHTEVREVKTSKDDGETVEEKKEVTKVSKTGTPGGGQVTTQTKETRTTTTTKKRFVDPELQKRMAARQRERAVAKREQATSAKNKRMAFMQKLEANSPETKGPTQVKRSASNVDKLLAWVRFKTRDYEGIKLSNFSSSWADGLAFCALIHLYLPDKIPYQELLEGNDKRRNFEVAFSVATEAGVPELLEVDDMLSVANPEPKSVMTYVSSIYKHFNPS